MKEGKQSLVAADPLAPMEIAEISSIPGDRQRRLLMLVVTGALILCFAVPLIPFFEHAAISDLHSYILLIPFVAGYLFWTKRKMLPRHYSASPITAICLVLLGFAFLSWAATAHRVGVISDNDLLSLVAISFVSFLTAAGFCFLGRKKTIFAKHIYIISQFFTADHRKHFMDNKINISLVIFFILQWISMSAKKSGPDQKV